MGTIVIVISQPIIQVGLQFFDGSVDLSPERDLVKSLQDRFVEAFANSIGLRVAHLRFCVLDIVQGQVELIIVRFRFAAIFRASIR